MCYTCVGLLATFSVAYTTWHCPRTGNWLGTLFLDLTLAQASVAAIVLVMWAVLFEVTWVRDGMHDYCYASIMQVYRDIIAPDFVPELIHEDDDTDTDGDDTDKDDTDTVAVMRRVLQQCTIRSRKVEPTEPPCPLCKENFTDCLVRLGLHPPTPTAAWIRVALLVDDDKGIVVMRLTTPACLHVTIAPSMEPFGCRRCAGRMHAECACALVASGHMKCLHCTAGF